MAHLGNYTGRCGADLSGNDSCPDCFGKWNHFPDERVARALLGTRVNRFSMLVNAGELTWNAPNTIETNRGKERYFLVRRKIRHDRSEVFFLPDDIEQTRTAYSEEFTPYLSHD